MTSSSTSDEADVPLREMMKSLADSAVADVKDLDREILGGTIQWEICTLIFDRLTPQSINDVVYMQNWRLESHVCTIYGTFRARNIH